MIKYTHAAIAALVKRSKEEAVEDFKEKFLARVRDHPDEFFPNDYKTLAKKLHHSMERV